MPGRLYTMLAKAEKAAGMVIPYRLAFHIFRHTWATWMRRHAGLDTAALVETGAWKSRKSASVYEHLDASEEAKKGADSVNVGVKLTLRL
jgi:integrase